MKVLNNKITKSQYANWQIVIYWKRRIVAIFVFPITTLVIVVLLLLYHCYYYCYSNLLWLIPSESLKSLIHPLSLICCRFYKHPRFNYLHRVNHLLTIYTIYSFTPESHIYSGSLTYFESDDYWKSLIHHKSFVIYKKLSGCKDIWIFQNVICL